MDLREELNELKQWHDDAKQNKDYDKQRECANEIWEKLDRYWELTDEEVHKYLDGLLITPEMFAEILIHVKRVRIHAGY